MGKYYLGLDIGTGSVGWAVTDKNYNLLKRKGKTLWGFHLFETANTAEERRNFRSARRRLQRKKQRISLLQELFSEEICKVDPGFFLRLKESRYVKEDKRDLEGNMPVLPYNLFIDSELNDKEYHKKYPTIYHLRWELMHSREKQDIRLVYLALHHIMKHRGHFLFEGKSIETISAFAPVFENFIQVLNDELGMEYQPCEEILRDVELILTNKDLGISKRKTKLCTLFQAKTVQEKAIWNLIAGGTVKLADLFADESLNEQERNKISFADHGYDEYASEVEDILLERYFLVAKAKSIYDWALLQEILQGAECLSEAKVQIYNKHKEDLQLLKRTAKAIGKKVYDNIFGNPGTKMDNYSAYIGMYKVNGRKKELERKRCNQEDFYKFLKKALQGQSGSDIDKILDEIAKGTFLPLQVMKDNGVIPYQIHELELNQILENAKAYYPFLGDKDENGISTIEKIQSIFRFRIPYYVGPLNDAHKDDGFCWAVRRSSKKIYPWNFTDIIDLEESANMFIRRMTNKCTYLAGEDVLPK